MNDVRLTGGCEVDSDFFCERRVRRPRQVVDHV